MHPYFEGFGPALETLTRVEHAMELTLVGVDVRDAQLALIG